MKIFSSLRQDSIGWMFSFFCCFGIGIFPLFYKKLSNISDNFITIFLLIFFSCIFSFIASFIYTAIKGFTVIKLKKKDSLIFLLLGFLTIFGNMFFLFSINFISPGIAQLIQRTEIIFVLYLCYFFFAERVSVKLNIAIFIILFGMYFLKVEDNSISLIASFFPVIFAIISAFFFALMQVILQIIVRRNDPIFVNFIRLFIALCLLFFHPDSWSVLERINTEILFWAFICAFIGPFFSRLSYSLASRRLPVSTIVLITPLAPLLTLALELLFFGTQLTYKEWFGFFVVLGGVYTALKFR